MTWQHALKDYQLYLKIERGLSKNSITNYALDVKKLIVYLEVHAINESPLTISTETIQQFIYETSKVVNTRSQSRLISGLRSFFSYLVFEDYLTSNPLDLIESPIIGRKLPDTLSEKEIDALINAIDLSQTYNQVKIGERNRAMLEHFMAAGCGLAN